MGFNSGFKGLNPQTDTCFVYVKLSPDTVNYIKSEMYNRKRHIFVITFFKNIFSHSLRKSYRNDQLDATV